MKAFFVYEEDRALDFFFVLREFQFSEESNKWVRRYSRDGVFSIHSTYQTLVELRIFPDNHLFRENQTLPLI